MRVASASGISQGRKGQWTIPTDFIGLFAMLAAVQALTVAGYRPLAPVDPIALADPEQRREWKTVRNMQVFRFWDSSNTRPTVDIMLSPEVPIEELRAAASVMSLGGHEVRVASMEHLIRMKVVAGRPQDIADIERLQAKLKG